MCGIAGICDFSGQAVPERSSLEKMIAPLRHRGPDGYGFYRAPGIGFAHARLSIIDIDGGWQPLSNEDETVWICFNGEIYNYPELRKDLLRKGHVFKTESDTETLVHLYEDIGIRKTLDKVNGQFAFALWDAKTQQLFLARDHVGIHPLHYTVDNNRIFFASEIKGLIAGSKRSFEMDPLSLDQVFTFWGSLSGRTLFKNVQEVPPGHYLEVRGGKTSLVPYWEPPLFDVSPNGDRSLDSYAEELYALLEDACRLRLRADVPVGSYLSGGLDSSVITCMTRKIQDEKLRTFSVAFEDSDFDESHYQNLVNDFLETDNSAIRIRGTDIADAFAKVIGHTETPIVRTAPTPLFLLSRSVRDAGFKTVLTGEGADEFLGGYDIYKEALLRSFWERQPDSACRAGLVKKLYPYLEAFSSNTVSYLPEYFKPPAGQLDRNFSSHWVRSKATSRVKMFYTGEFRRSLDGYNSMTHLQDKYGERLEGGGTLARAQFLESATLLPNYLLSSQGDRMAMANSVEVRFPFLDKRVIEFSCRIPPHYKIMGLNEKAVLKKAVRKRLPEEIVRRHKRPYMAPDIRSFITEGRGFHPIVDEFLAERAVASGGMFRPNMVESLKKKALAGKTIGFGDNMAFVGILSTQIWASTFLHGLEPTEPIDDEKVKVDRIITSH